MGADTTWCCQSEKGTDRVGQTEMRRGWVMSKNCALVKKKSGVQVKRLDVNTVIAEA